MKKETKENVKEDNKEEVQRVSSNGSSGKLWGIIILLLAIAGVAGYVITDKQDNEMALTSSEPEIISEENEIASTEVQTNASAETSEGASIVVAEVEGREITRADIEEFIENIPQLQQQPMEQVFPLAREELITGEIIDIRADKEGTANDPEVEERLNLAREGIVRTVYLENKVNTMLTDDVLRSSYNDFISQQEGTREQEVKASHILVDSEEKATDIIAKIKSGEDFAKLAKEMSSDTASGANGGDLGYFTKGQMVPAFSKAAFALEKGEVTDAPVKSQFGYHIIKVEDKRQQELPSFEEVRTFLEVQERREILETLLQNWRKEADVTLYNIDGSKQVMPATPAQESSVQEQMESEAAHSHSEPKKADAEASAETEPASDE